jgi:hypothetical protein
MNLVIPDHLYELNNRKIERDRTFILREEMLNPRPGFGVLLNALGAWMIAKGESLRKRYSVTRKAVAPSFLKDATIFKA